MGTCWISSLPKVSPLVGVAGGRVTCCVLLPGEPSLDMASLPFGVSLPLQCVLLRKGMEPSMEYNRRELEAIGEGKGRRGTHI